MIFDVAAGILIAALIIGMVWGGFAYAGQQPVGDKGGGLLCGLIGFLVGAAIVIWRVFFHP